MSVISTMSKMSNAVFFLAFAFNQNGTMDNHWNDSKANSGGHIDILDIMTIRRLVN